MNPCCSFIMKEFRLNVPISDLVLIKQGVIFLGRSSLRHVFTIIPILQLRVAGSILTDAKTPWVATDIRRCVTARPIVQTVRTK